MADIHCFERNKYHLICSLCITAFAAVLAAAATVTAIHAKSAMKAVAAAAAAAAAAVATAAAAEDFISVRIFFQLLYWSKALSKTKLTWHMLDVLQLQQHRQQQLYKEQDQVLIKC